MYFVSINGLKKDFLEGKVTEKESLKYLIGMIILYGISPSQGNTADGATMLAAAIVGLAISIIGLICAYKSNNGSSGNQFLVKYIAISFVVSIRFILISIPFVIVILAALQGYINSGSYSPNPDLDLLIIIVSIALVALAATILYYWRICVHISEIKMTT